MEADSEPISFDKSEIYEGSDLLNVKTIIFMFFLFLFICSDFFIESGLSKISNKLANGKSTTNLGVVTQGGLYVGMTSIFAYLVKTQVI